MTDDAPRVVRCPTCHEQDFEMIDDDVARCRNCTRVWIVEEAPRPS